VGVGLPERRLLLPTGRYLAVVISSHDVAADRAL